MFKTRFKMSRHCTNNTIGRHFLSEIYLKQQFLKFTAPKILPSGPKPACHLLLNTSPNENLFTGIRSPGWEENDFSRPLQGYNVFIRIIYFRILWTVCRTTFLRLFLNSTKMRGPYKVFNGLQLLYEISSATILRSMYTTKGDWESQEFVRNF